MPVDPAIARPVSNTVALLDVALTSSFWDLPWPSDARRTADGKLELSAFPNPGDSTLIERYRAHAAAELDGFGTAGPTYVRFNGPVNLPAWSPAAAAAAGRCEGSVRILDVDPDSPARGTCLPARWQFTAANTADPFLPVNGVAIAPLWGFPFRGGNTYAVYLVDLEGPSGFVRAHPDLEALLRGAGPPDLQVAYQPFADFLPLDPLAAGESAEQRFVAEGGEDEALPPDGIDRRWIAHATVFTTQDPRTDLRRIAEYVATEPDLIHWEGDIAALPPDHPEFQELYELREGTYRAPNFQRGTLPYATEGGALAFDGDGVPEVQLDELIPFAVGFPREGVEQPAAGWPVILHSHGTGGDQWSHLSGSANLRPGLLGANRRFLSIGIPQPFHGDRWPEGSDTSISILSFNFNNPESGRSNFRQGAIDILSLERLVREEFAEGGEIAAAYPDLRIDPENIYFLGHSQGGLTGSLALPFAQHIKGWVLSGAGAGLSITILQRTDPVNFRELVESAVATPGLQLDDMHPVLALVQMLVDVTDPLNYASGFYREQEGAPRSILLTEGLSDAQTPADTSETLAVAAGLPIAEPFEQRAVLGLELQDLTSSETPYGANAQMPDGTPITVGLAQFDSNHFAIFNDANAAQLWANFLQSMVELGAPGELGYDP